MGAVYLAHDLTLEREVAIKVLPPDISMDEHIVKRFPAGSKDRREARPHQHHSDLPRRE
jgi:hypothetical protein